MGMLEELGTGQGYLKAGLFGFQGSGKTWTAVLFALGLRKHFKLEGPIVMYDTEGGSEYIAKWIHRDTGKPLIGKKTRAFSDLVTITREAEAIGASALIIDSVTHTWQELCKSYMKRLNEARMRASKPTKSRMDVGDIMAIKELWAEFPDLYLNSKLHIIICGRAGFQWERLENEETGKMELMKTGVKMKVEGDFGFEPSLLIEMERKQDLTNGIRVYREATVLKDRFGLIDGKLFEDPTFASILPHINELVPGAFTPIDVSAKTEVPVDDDGNSAWQKEKRERAIYSEEIQGLLLKYWPGQTAKEKGSKAKMIEDIFGTRSWTNVENMKAEWLKEGLERMRDRLKDVQVEEAAS